MEIEFNADKSDRVRKVRVFSEESPCSSAFKKTELGNRTQMTQIHQGGNADYHRLKNNKIRVHQRLALAIRVISVPKTGFGNRTRITQILQGGNTDYH